ncbi:MAG: hypothetical protein ABSG98_05045 [Anaerolineales bacterium]
MFPLFYRETAKLNHLTPTSLKGYRMHILKWIFWLYDKRGIDRPDEIGHQQCVDHLIEYSEGDGRTHSDGTPWPLTDASVRTPSDQHHHLRDLDGEQRLRLEHADARRDRTQPQEPEEGAHDQTCESEN